MATLNEEYLKKFRRCVNEHTLNEYLSMGVNSIEEDDPAAAQDPAAADPNAAPGGDPSAMGGAPMDPNAGGDPSAMGGDPNAAPGGDPNAAADPNAMGGAPAGPEGFAPQGADPMMGGDPNAMGGAPAPGDEVVDVDELIDSQEESEKKIDAMTGQFAELMGKMASIEQGLNSFTDKMNNLESSLTAKIEQSNPSPEQRLSMISTKSAPYGMSPQQAMDNCAPDNYSTEDDNNGADDPQYQILKSDIDNFTDYNSIRDSFDDQRKNMGLHDIFGY